MKRIFKFMLVSIMSFSFFTGCFFSVWSVEFINQGDVMFSVDVKNKETIDLPGNPVRNGYEFLGWFESEDSDVAFSEELEIKSDMTFCAKWQAKEIVLNFVTNSELVQSDMTYTFDDNSSLPVLAIENMYFDGWFFDTELQNKADISQIYSSTTLYAKWTQFFGEAIYNGSTLEETGNNTFILTIASEGDYNHPLLSFEPVSIDYTYQVGNSPEFIDGQAEVNITIFDNMSNEIGISTVLIEVE